MGHPIRLKVYWSGAESDQVISSVKDYLGRDGSIDLFGELGEAFFDESMENEWFDPRWVKRLFCFLSGRFPEEEFGVRGVGEGIDDAWVLWFRAGRVLRAACLDREREGSLRSEIPTVDWPEPLEVGRVVRQAGLKTFLREFVLEQPPTATVMALTLRSRSDGRPRALVHVGPLGHDVHLRIENLFRPTYEVKMFRDAEELLKDPTATAKDPCGY